MREISTVSAEMDAAKIVEENDDFLVVPLTIARAGVFEFQKSTGKLQGYRSAEELKKSAFTFEGAWVVAERHIPTVFVVDPRDIRGRVEKTKWCDDIQGVIGQVRWFKKSCEPTFLEAIRKGVKKDVSPAYFCDDDYTPGQFAGQKYDFVQRNIMGGHLAAGLKIGRCPSPFCGMHVDSLQAMFDPEETEDYIRIPINEGAVVATITLSEEQGIKALVGRKDGKSYIITYLFLKEKGWTMEKAQEWVDKHKQDSMDEEPKDTEAIKARILQLGETRQGIMDGLYPKIEENTPERAKKHLEVSVIDEQIKTLTQRLAEQDAASDHQEKPKQEERDADPLIELARATELVRSHKIVNIRRKTYPSSASN